MRAAVFRPVSVSSAAAAARPELGRAAARSCGARIYSTWSCCRPGVGTFFLFCLDPTLGYWHRRTHWCAPQGWTAAPRFCPDCLTTWRKYGVPLGDDDRYDAYDSEDDDDPDWDGEE